MRGTDRTLIFCSQVAKHFAYGAFHLRYSLAPSSLSFTLQKLTPLLPSITPKHLGGVAHITGQIFPLHAGCRWGSPADLRTSRQSNGLNLPFVGRVGQLSWTRKLDYLEFGYSHRQKSIRAGPNYFVG